MKRLLKKLASTGNSLAFLPLRLAIGLIMMGHGSQKLFGWFDGGGLDGTGEFFQGALNLEPGIFWAVLVGCAEFFGGLLILAGLLTRLGALFVAGTMAGAIIMVHNTDFFGDNGMEFPLLLLLGSVTLLISGAGGCSVDRAIAKSKDAK